MPRRVGNMGASGYDDAPAQPNERNSSPGNRSTQTILSDAFFELLDRFESHVSGGSSGHPAARRPPVPAPNPSFAHAQAPVAASRATVPTSSTADESFAKNLLAGAWIAPDLTRLRGAWPSIVSQALTAIQSGNYQNMVPGKTTDGCSVNANCLQIFIAPNSYGAKIDLKADGTGILSVVSCTDFQYNTACRVSWAAPISITPTPYDELAPTSADRAVIDALTRSIEQKGTMPSREWENADGSLTSIFEGVGALGQNWHISTNRPPGQSLCIVATAGMRVVSVHISDSSVDTVGANPSVGHGQPQATAPIAIAPAPAIADIEKLLAHGWIAPNVSRMHGSWQTVIPGMMDKIRSGAYADVQLRNSHRSGIDIDCSGIRVGPNTYTASFHLNVNGTGALGVLCIDNSSQGGCPVAWATSTAQLTPTFAPYATLPTGDRNFADALTTALEVNRAASTRQWLNGDGSLTHVHEGMELDGRQWHVSSCRPSAHALYVVASSGSLVFAFHRDLYAPLMANMPT